MKVIKLFPLKVYPFTKIALLVNRTKMLYVAFDGKTKSSENINVSLCALNIQRRLHMLANMRVTSRTNYHFSRTFNAKTYMPAR